MPTRTTSTSLSQQYMRVSVLALRVVQMRIAPGSRLFQAKVLCHLCTSAHGTTPLTKIPRHIGDNIFWGRQSGEMNSAKTIPDRGKRNCKRPDSICYLPAKKYLWSRKTTSKISMARTWTGLSAPRYLSETAPKRIHSP